MANQRIAVITPSIGNKYLARAIESVKQQTIPCSHYVYIDGRQYWDKVPADNAIAFTHLEENTGAGGNQGYIIYSKALQEIDADYLFLLDEDNWYSPNHVETVVNLINRHKVSWAHSLRNLMTHDGVFLYQDNSDSIGFWAPNHFVDPSCIGYTKECAQLIAPIWRPPYSNYHYDRVVSQIISTQYHYYGCTGQYTCNFSMTRNPAIQTEWHKYHNKRTAKMYPNGYPWAGKESLKSQ